VTGINRDAGYVQADALFNEDGARDNGRNSGGGQAGRAPRRSARAGLDDVGGGSAPLRSVIRNCVGAAQARSLAQVCSETQRSADG